MNARIRAILLQALLAAAVAVAGAWLLQNLSENLASRNISTGFGFLSSPAGFAIGESHLKYGPADSFGLALAVGLINTLKVAALAILLSTILGFALGLARLSMHPLVAGLSRGYVELVRNVPLLLQLLFLYAALLNLLPAYDPSAAAGRWLVLTNRGLAMPALHGAAGAIAGIAAGIALWYAMRRRARGPRLLAAAGVVLATGWLAGGPPGIDLPVAGRFNVEGGWQLSAELLTLVLGLSLYTAGYLAEIVRGGLASVPTGQREAAAALGLSEGRTTWHITLPQAMRAIVPPMTSWHLNTVKNSSLAIAVGYPDLVSVVDTIINQTGQAVEGVLIIVGAYLTVNLAISAALAAYNRRLVGRGMAPAGRLPSPAHALGGLRSLRSRLLASRASAITTLLLGVVLAAGLWFAVDWLFLSAVISGSASECRAASGACWPFIADNWRRILFGTYPRGEHWRGGMVIGLFCLMLAMSFRRRLWGPGLALAWAGALASMSALLAGGFAGLVPVPTDKWSGLPLTLVLAGAAVLLAFPMAVALAVARNSRRFPLASGLSTAFIELTRGIPLLGVLFLAAVLFPLFMPPGVELDGVVRVQVALVLFTAAYMAEAVRGGLQSVPRGQREAAIALGLGPAQALRHVVLPQALRISVPGLANTAISEVKNTTLVLIVGLFDVLQTTRLVLVNVEWRPYYIEAYLFTGTIFFCICYAISQISARLERTQDDGKLAPR